MYLYGASGHCKVIIDSIKSSTDTIIEGVFDDKPTIETILNIPVINFNTFDKSKLTELIISVGKNITRKKLAESIQANYVSVVHPTAIVSKYATIACGTVVLPKCVINAEAKIGKHCIINTGAVVEHDCILSDFVHISPNAALAGNVEIGEGSHIGIGAVVIQGVKIGKWATIGAGAVIINNVPDGAVMVGIPARNIKK